MTSGRIKTFGVCIAAAMMVLVARLWWLQLTHWSEYATKALGNRICVVTEPAPRGEIRDRRNLVLAENREVWNLRIRYSELPKEEAVLERQIAFLAGVLSTPDSPVSTADIRKALQGARVGGPAGVTSLGDLGQDLSFDQVAAIEEHQMEVGWLRVVTGTRRHYPYGTLGSQVVGYARPNTGTGEQAYRDLQFPRDPQDPTAQSVITSRDLVYGPEAIVGEEGAEALCELDKSVTPPVPILPGRPGRTVYEVDAAGSLQRLLAERAPVAGATVWLTLDAQWQFIAQKALREAFAGKAGGMGAVVVMDVRTGDVLVLASEPCIDPNDWVAGMTGAMWQQAMQAPGLPLLSKAIAGRYPPGSVFKVISICAALETTKVRVTSSAYCTGRIYVGSRHEPFRCWMADRGGHGPVDLLDAIGRSCNIFFYDCVRRFGLDPDDIARYAREFGLGETTGLGLPGEVPGTVPSPRYSVSETGVPWQLGNSLNLVIGQDRLAVTPLQMCVVCAAVANGGELLRPNLVKRIRWPSYMHRPDTVHEVGQSRRLRVRPETLAIVRHGMRRAVTGRYGTARALKGIGVDVAGKTGSAQPGGDKRTHAWFICYAPVDEPRYAICVFASEAGTGSEVAVPIASRMLRGIFGLYDRGNPLYELPPPMDPRTVAEHHHQRVAAARAWLQARAGSQGPHPGQREQTPRPKTSAAATAGAEERADEENSEHTNTESSSHGSPPD